MSQLTQTLLEQLNDIDQAIQEIWIAEKRKYASVDEDVWEHFVELLEYRVSLLQTLLDTGYEFSKEEIWPLWLDDLCSRKMIGFRKRISFLVADKKIKKNIKIYEDVGQNR